MTSRALSLPQQGKLPSRLPLISAQVIEANQPGHTWVVALTSKEALQPLLSPKEALGTPLAHRAQVPVSPTDQNLVLFVRLTKVGFPKQSLKARFPVQKDGSGAREHMVGSEMKWKCRKEQG